MNHEPHDNPRALLLSLYQTALQAVQGRTQVANFLRTHQPNTSLALIAIGKAAPQMAAGAFDILGTQITSALVITKTGHFDTTTLLPTDLATCLEAAHPIPDASSLLAGNALISFINQLPPHHPVLFLLSGGTSALVEVLAKDIQLSELQQVNQWLLASGLDIYAINQIRQSLSLIKGGRLTNWLHGHHVLSLLISDVPGDDLRVIGSGLLTTEQLPKSPVIPTNLPTWIQHLVATAPPLATLDGITQLQQHIIAGPATARHAVTETAHSLGYTVNNYPEIIVGEAEAVGRTLAQQLSTAKPGIYVWSSETTVHLPPHPGQGGRCQTLALAVAAELAGLAGAEPSKVYLLAAGTDGNDGPGMATGALIDHTTIARGTSAGFNVNTCLSAADAGSFLAASGDLLYTGPTGTNVMDLLIGLK